MTQDDKLGGEGWWCLDVFPVLGFFILQWHPGQFHSHVLSNYQAVVSSELLILWPTFESVWVTAAGLTRLVYTS